mgnify:CR=1 FL=1
MFKILFIPYLACYDRSKGAGCKVENFYIKELARREEFDFRVLTFEDFDDEYESVIQDMKEYGIKGDVVCRDRSTIAKIKRGVRNIPSKYSPFDKYANFTSIYYLDVIRRYIKKYKCEGFIPDCVILGWTQIIVYISEIKRLLPDAVVIAIEEDVSFLGIQRKLDNEKDRFKQIILKQQYDKLRKVELESLSLADYAYVNNPKDFQLLIENGLDASKIDWLVPWYDKYNKSVIRNIDWDKPFIIYYGAMGRPENYLSVQWLIENIMPLINSKIRLVVIGSGSETIEKFASERVDILGFVDNVSPFFSRTMCLVAPLVLGAGIKIKVLEAMSAGVPVLTNQIGIEGVEAKSGKDYFYCKDAVDYANVINLAYEKKIELESISKNARLITESKYDYSKSGQMIANKVIDLLMTRE